MSNTSLRLVCQTKKESNQGVTKEGKISNSFEISFYLGYSSDPTNPNYPWTQLSGGSAMTLLTINEDAANNFEVGKSYPINIGEAI